MGYRSGMRLSVGNHDPGKGTEAQGLWTRETFGSWTGGEVKAPRIRGYGPLCIFGRRRARARLEWKRGKRARGVQTHGPNHKATHSETQPPS